MPRVRQGGLMSKCHPMTMSSGIPLLDVLPDAKPINADDFIVRSACGQWSECQIDDVFVAVVGSESDGHDFAADAVARGASAVIGERLMAVSGPQFLVDDSRLAFGQLCHALAGRPSKRMCTIGIAGCNGKTVTSHLVQSILKEAGMQAGLATSIATQFGSFSSQPKSNQSAAAIADQLNNMVLAKCTHAVVEASSSSLAQHTMAGFEMDIAVVTNLKNKQSSFQESALSHQRFSQRLADYLKPAGFTILNADDRATAGIIDEIQSPCLTFGIHGNAEVTATLLNRNRSCQTFVLSAGIESIPVRTGIIGKQHIYNCLAAATVGLALEIELDVVARGLENAVIPGRLERVDCGQQFGVWVDSAITPEQLSGAIAAIAPVCEGRIFCIGSTDDSQSDDDKQYLGRILECKTDVPIISHAKLANRVDYESCHQVLDGFEKVAKAQIMPNRINAIQWALSQAKREDCVLITGAGEKALALIGDSESAVTDRDICQAWLYDNSDLKPSSPQIFNIDDFRT